ncbi:MAG: CPBP family intramembrane glutamic endopeptidase [Bacteroidia bacterium]
MFKIPTFSSHPLVYFIWNFLILTGMVITFYIIGGVLGIAITKTFFGIDLQSTFSEIIYNSNTNPQGVMALKLNQALISITIFVVPAFLFCRAIEQNPIRFLQLKHKTKWYNYLFIIILIILALPVSSWLMELNQNFHLPEYYKDFETFLRGDEAFAKLQMEAFVNANTISQLLFNIVIVAVIPAITEEVFFRGCLQNFVRRCFYNLHVSVIFTAIIFSAIHGDYFGFLPRFMFGLVLGYAFAYSGNIWVSIVGHFLNNCITIVAYFIAQKNPNIAFLKDDYSFPIIFTLIGCVGIIAILFAMSKLRFNQIFLNNKYD